MNKHELIRQNDKVECRRRKTMLYLCGKTMKGEGIIYTVSIQVLPRPLLHVSD